MLEIKKTKSITGNDDSSSNQAANGQGKEKLMHSFISAMEHLLPIEHKSSRRNSRAQPPNNETTTSYGTLVSSENQKSSSEKTPQNSDGIANISLNHENSELGDSSDSITRSHSFLNNLNSILQNNGHVHSCSNVKKRNKIFNTNADKRTSIFSDSEIELRRSKDQSSLKESSLKSIDFSHIKKNREASFDDHENMSQEDSADSMNISDFHEDPDPLIEIETEDPQRNNSIGDDYILNGRDLSNSYYTKPSAPQRAVSDIPKSYSNLGSSSTFDVGKENNTISNAESLEINGGPHSDSNNEDLSGRKKTRRFKRGGTISIAPLSLSKLRSRSRANSNTKQDLLESRSKNNSSTGVYNLGTQKSNVSMTSKEDENSSGSDDQEEVFSCALQKDILLQGKLYLSKDKIKFQSKIFGIKTTVSFFIKDIVQIEKKLTAMLFPNGIVIKTVDKDYIFASFLNRDLVFEKIMKRWGDVVMTGIYESSNSDSDKIVKEKDLSTKQTRNEKRVSCRSLSSFKNGRNSVDNDLKRGKSSNNITFKLPELFDSQGDSMILRSPLKRMLHGVTDSEGSDDSESDGESSQDEDDMTSNDEYEPEDVSKSNGKNKKDGSSAGSFGPSAGKPYTPNLAPYNKDVDISEDVIKNTTLGTVFKIFSDNMGVILEKCGNYNISKVEKLYPYDDNGEKLKANEFKREYSYTKPLNSSLGPKETTCQVADVLTEVDLNKCFILKQTTLTPDVPSGKSFSVITHILVFWSGESSVTIKCYTKVIWTGKSWIKGPVESGNTSGQKQSMTSLVREVQNLSDNFKPSQQPPQTKRKVSATKPSKVLSPEPKEPVLAQTDEEANAPSKQVPSSFVEGLLNNITNSKNVTAYLMWAIVIYLLLDKIFTRSNTIIVQNPYTSQYSKQSEADIWSWVLERTESDKTYAAPSSENYSFSSNSLSKFTEQDLFAIKELKENELQIIKARLNRINQP